VYRDIIGYMLENHNVSTDPSHAWGHLYNLAAYDPTTAASGLALSQGPKSGTLGEFNVMGLAETSFNDQHGTPNLLSTQRFGLLTDTSFIAGVMFNDNNGNGAYDPGEGLAGQINIDFGATTTGGITVDGGEIFQLQGATGYFVAPVPASSWGKDGSVTVSYGSHSQTFNVRFDKGNIFLTARFSPGYGLTDLGNSGSTPVIAPDLYEPNDTAQTATDLGTATNANAISGELQNLTIDKPSDQDWFKFTLAAKGGTANKIDLSLDTGGGQVQGTIYVQSSTGQLTPAHVIGIGDSLGETLDLDGLDAGTYYLKVTGVNNDTTFYSLQVNATAALSPIQNYVETAYQDVLGRSVDAPSLASFSSALAAGASRASFIATLEGSDEYRTVQLQSVYEQLLQRSVDNTALAAFLPMLRSGGSIRQVEVALSGSPEYYQNRGGGTDSGFVTALFQDALNRIPDAASLSYFTGLLGNGAPRASIAAILYGGAEHDQWIVQNLYQFALHRPADSSALSGLTTALQQGMREEDILPILMGSNEFFTANIDARGDPNQIYVLQLFQELLGRDADASSLAYLSGLLDQGVSRLQVVHIVQSSAEYATRELKIVYQELLNRDADSAALAAFVPYLQSGGAIRQIQEILAGSPEYYQIRGGGTVSGFVTALFEDTLNRKPDAASLSFFTAQLASGMTRPSLVATLYDSADHDQVFTQGLFQNLLGRPADSGALAGFTTDLQQGIREEDLTALVLSSNEYINQP
jgi:hypothetical protein